MKFTKEHLEILESVWPKGTKEEIQQALPDFAYGTLANHAYRNNIRCTRSRKKNGDLSPLLEDTQLSYYWLGFIVADGHFSKQNQLVVMISEKDKTHLQKLADYISTDIKYPYGKDIRNDKSGYEASLPLIRIAVQGKEAVPKIQEKLGLTNTNKTYHPISIYNIPEEFRLSFLVGFIDGDGSRAATSFKIENHFAWAEFYKELESLYKFANYTNLVTAVKKTAKGRFYEVEAKQMANHIKEHNLPVMERKWNGLL